MNWRDDPIGNDEDGEPMFRGSLSLVNDKGELLAGIVWFFDEGPFYAHAMDPANPDVIRQIDPIRTLEAAKQRCFDAMEGRIPDLSKRAGYQRT